MNGEENKVGILLETEEDTYMERLDMLNFIDGEWTGETLDKIEVTNPATGEIVGTVPNGGEKETEQAIEAAHRAFKEWSKWTASDRADLLRKYFQIILDHKEELAELMTLEISWTSSLHQGGNFGDVCTGTNTILMWADGVPYIK